MNDYDTDYVQPGKAGGGGGGAVSIAFPNLRGTLTLRVLFACVALYVAQALLALLGIWSREGSYSLLGLSRAGLLRGMLWQPVTSPFLHFGIMHLLFNMLALAFLGVDVERRLGKGRYLLFSAACALGGSAGFLLLGTPRAIAVGYSGVIFGIMAATAVFWPNRMILMFYFFPMKMKWAMALMMVAAIFLMADPGGAGVAHAAHLGGAVVGLALVWAWKNRGPAMPRKPSPPKAPGDRRKRQPGPSVPDQL